MESNEQNTNSPLQWEIVFLLTLVMFPLVGIGPIVAFTVGYFFRRRGWGWNLGLMGLMVLGIQLLVLGSIFVVVHFASEHYSNLISEKELFRLFNILSIFTFFIIPIIGVIIGFIKRDKYWATLLKQVSLSCLLVVAFIFSNAYYDSFSLYHDDSFIVFTKILLGFPIIFISVCAYRYRHRWNWEVFISGIILITLNTFFVTVATPGFKKARNKARCAETKSNLHCIQTALDRHSIDTGGNYPESIQILIDLGYLKEFPTNSFTGQPMKDIEFGSDGYTGNFTYLTHIVDGYVNGYYLFCYGESTLPALDINQDGVFDHVIMVLLDSYPGSGPRRPLHTYVENSNSEESEEAIEYQPVREYVQLPDIKYLLNETYVKQE